MCTYIRISIYGFRLWRLCFFTIRLKYKLVFCVCKIELQFLFQLSSSQLSSVHLYLVGQKHMLFFFIEVKLNTLILEYLKFYYLF